MPGNADRSASLSDESKLQQSTDTVRDRSGSGGSGEGELYRRARVRASPSGADRLPFMNTALVSHAVLEAAAYAVGFRLYLREQRRLPGLPATDWVQGLILVAGTIAGAALGSKIAYWLYDPAYAFADFPDWRRLLEGKSIIGALLGGLCGVELSKRMAGIRGSTGDAFVWPLTVGMVIGRIGCFLGGLFDHTYGNPTSLPWAIDFGDGIARHPTQLYEIGFLLLWSGWLALRAPHFARGGDRFRAFLAGYLVYRLLIEWIRPMPFTWFGMPLSGLQLLCIVGLLYYARDIPRLAKALSPWPR